VSIDAAIGRIDQIVQLQQQIFDPGAATQGLAATTGGTAASAGGSTATGSTASTFAAALADAQTTEDAATEASGLEAASAGNDPSSAASADLASTELNPSASILPTVPSTLPTLASSSGVGDAASVGSASLATATAGANGATATNVSDPRVQAMIQEADSLLGEPYVWGGGHSGWAPQAGYDCSGFVSAVLHAGGYLTSPQDTDTLPSAAGIEPGPGQYVTIYDRNEPGQEGHVIIDIAGQFYESGGEAGSWGGGGGVEKIGTPSAAYLATFNDVLHPAGL
jgi:cell wall-associated NlpC family hydrolase